MTEDEMERLREFRRIVNKCAREDLDWVITNRSPYRARYLISKLFEVGQKWIDIYAGDLSKYCRFEGDVAEIYSWPELIDSAKKFLSKEGTRLRIITQRPIDGGTDNPFVSAMLDDEARRGEVEILVAREGVLAPVKQHFIAVDRRAYRFETDHENAVATANFNSPEFAKRLHWLFEDMAETLVNNNLADRVHCPLGGEGRWSNI